MMQEIYQKKVYPADVLIAIRNSGRLGVALANRWMLGWPEQVKELIASQEYLTAFKNQHEQEVEALATAQDCRHLAEMEIIAVSGLAMGPPTIS